ncbi:P-loop containing nucleoside triphosphate hydrolase protein, partial [Lasiosphaeria ovina]
MTILLLGPTGSGKSSFIHRATGSPDVKIGDGTLPCTTECEVFETILKSKHRGAVSLSFLDTPGFDDIPIRDLKILGDIARHLRDLPPVCGVLHFHRITDRRLMGTSRFNLEMLKTITGEGFSDRVAFVTTMWDTIPADLQPRYEALIRE